MRNVDKRELHWVLGYPRLATDAERDKMNIIPYLKPMPVIEGDDTFSDHIVMKPACEND